MIRTYATLAALALAMLGVQGASAAERRYTLSTFDKVRIDGDVAVEIVSGAAPSALAIGDPRALDALTVRVQGGTLSIRRARASQLTERRKQSGTPDALPLVRLSARAVQSLMLQGHGSVRIDRLTGARPNATLNGSGSIDIGVVQADALALNVSGSGSLKAAGTATSARAVMLGDGLIEATGLSLSSLDLFGEGPVRARMTVDGPARISVMGDAQIEIGGQSKCIIRQSAANAIACSSIETPR